MFLLALDWIMKTSTDQKRNGVQLTLCKQLEDLDFAEDLALLSHTLQQMQEIINIVVDNSARHQQGKSKIFKTNTFNKTPTRCCKRLIPPPILAASWTSREERMQTSEPNPH
jgi:hypothetical protein